MTRRVRVTVEGEAQSRLGGRLLVVTTADGSAASVPASGAGIVVEDVTPAYAWRDGDVVQRDSTWVRSGGQWCAPGAVGRQGDEWVTRLVVRLGARVLRYQAGEDA